MRKITAALLLILTSIVAQCGIDTSPSTPESQINCGIGTSPSGPCKPQH